MKLAGLVVGILLMLLAGIGAIGCLLLPSITNNKVDLEEAMLGFIPAVVIFLLAFLLTVVSAIFYFRGRKKIV